MTSTGGKAVLLDIGKRIGLEHYSEDYDRNTRFNSFSMAKSLIGAVVFKAIAEKKLVNLNVSIGRVLPELGEASLKTVTLRSLLTMRSGILYSPDIPIVSSQTKDLEETILNPFGPMARLHTTGLGAIGDRLIGLNSDVGQFRYQNVNTVILAAVLERVYGRAVEALLSEKIWQPAAAGTASWRRPSGEDAPVSVYCCIYAKPRDWILIGRYLMSNGARSSPFLPVNLWRLFMGLDHGNAKLRKGIYGYYIRQDILDRNGEALQGRFTYMLGQGRSGAVHVAGAGSHRSQTWRTDSVAAFHALCGMGWCCGNQGLNSHLEVMDFQHTRAVRGNAAVRQVVMHTHHLPLII